MKLKFMLAIVVLIWCALTYAGNERGNGGDAVVQPDGQTRFLDLVRKPNSVLLNIEDPKLAPALEAYMKSLDSLKNLTVFIDRDSFLFQTALMRAVRSLKYYLVDGPLPETNDRGVIQLPWKDGGRRIRRLAYQMIPNRIVLIDREVFEALPQSDLPSFLAHEGLIRLYHNEFYNPPLESTEKISTLVNQMFQSTSLPPSMITQYLCDMNIISSEKALEGWRAMSGILTPRAYPNEIVVTFRDQRTQSCYAFHLRADPNRSPKVRFYPQSRQDAVYTWYYLNVDNQNKAEMNLYFLPSELKTNLDLLVDTDSGGVLMPSDLYESKVAIREKKDPNM